MITLNLAIYDGSIMFINFEDTEELIEYLPELKRFDCIWLATNDGEYGEIFVTENIDVLINIFKANLFKIREGKYNKIFLQEYQTYEDAYNVALDMREGNERCYN